MGLNLRKMIVGLTALVILLGVYVAYTRWGGDTPIEPHAMLPLEPNDLTLLPDDQAVTIGDATIERISRAHLIRMGPDNTIKQDFRFLDLYHRQGKQLEVTRPFMTLYEDKFQCSVTSEKALVQLELAFERPAPGDATFSGNVVIHIVSTDPNQVGEAFIYLDDVVFTAAKSLFSTTGPVRFVSRIARLEGRGMELLYDEQRARLELFRIQTLSKLLLRSKAFAEFKDSKDSSDRPKQKPTAASTAGRSEPRSAPTAASAGPAPVAYECVLWKDVRIVVPERVVVAQDRFSIDNILWPGSKTDEPSRAKTADEKPADPPKAEPNESQSPALTQKDTQDAASSSALTLDSLPESLFDVVVTCRGGLVIRPMGTTSPDNPALKDAGDEAVAHPEEFEDASRQPIIARRIEVDALKKTATLVGPVQMKFLVDANNPFGSAYGGQKVPVNVTAQNFVRYLSDSNQVILDGNCVASTRIAEPNGTKECTLTAPTLVLSLIEDPNAKEKTTAANSLMQGTSMTLKQATASGGFRLHLLQKSGLETTGEFYMEGTRMEYDAQQKEFVATGPGQVVMHNSQEASGKEDANGMSLRKPCWALLKKFDRLTYSEATNRIVAASESKQLQVDYFELVKEHPDQFSKHVQADVGHIDIELAKADDERMELASLKASEGVAFRDGAQQFDASTLFYDQRKGLMSIRGDASRPCYLNGALVDGIEINMKTGQINTTVISPSTVNVSPQR
jgi:hypothetical protein